jgi:hypothetical protein
VRGIFFDEDDARAAALSLSRGGFAAEVQRERLAGEDDDEDHPWAVLTDAPEVVLELLVESYDGWLDSEEGLDTSSLLPHDGSPGGSGHSTSDGVPLPEQPQRIKKA